MLTSHLVKLIAGKALYGVVCLFAAVLLVVAGYAHKVVGQVNATGKGIVIPGAPSVGAMNILVMGLESRTNYQGQTLPNSLLTAMHAGSATAVNNAQVGSQDTNTLILIHIFAGGKKAVGFSVPRDDLVTYPQAYDGQTEGKIDGAYAYAYVQYVSQHIGKESNNDLYLHANQAGQAATIATVSAVTGQKIDHFVEVNLAGFYYLASAFGGIEVCIQPYPGNSGMNLTDYDPYLDPRAKKRPTAIPASTRSRTATTRRRAARSTCTWGRRSRWRSSGPATRSPVPTWGVPSGSRPSSTT